MPRKFNLEKSEDLDKFLKNLWEIDLDDEFLDNFEPKDEDANDSDATCFVLFMIVMLKRSLKEFCKEAI